ncbi:hypothetical protein QAD02_006409 [Eretmocerus hayati]|uniref:Uncharacterized protein n=1 Tax=Eretmocerus hayati TaxID=131215 RepID=A0ACC2N153_9HYME|nr:hypothetical protein QAD02_006409 [Eretmocerus hayati]
MDSELWPQPNQKKCNLTIEAGPGDDKLHNSTCIIPFANSSIRETIEGSRIFTVSDSVIVISGEKGRKSNAKSLVYFIFSPPNCIPMINKVTFGNVDLKNIVEQSLILSDTEKFEVIYYDGNNSHRFWSIIFNRGGVSSDRPLEFDFKIPRMRTMVSRIPMNQHLCTSCIQFLSEERLETSILFNQNAMELLNSKNHNIKISTAHGVLRICKQESNPSKFLNYSEGNLTSWYQLDMGFEFEDVVIYNLPKNEGIMVVVLHNVYEGKPGKVYYPQPSFVRHMVYLTMFDNQKTKYGNLKLDEYQSRNYPTSIYIYMYIDDPHEYCVAFFERGDFQRDYEHDVRCYNEQLFYSLIGRLT